jgi:cytochrome c oxidase cbb3-type subunit 1
MISAHFWLVLGGFGVYFIGLSFGGWYQGLAMLNKDLPFMVSVTLTIPYLQARSVGGALMTLGHLVFAAHFFMIALKFGPKRRGASLLTPPFLSPDAPAQEAAPVPARMDTAHGSVR